MGIGDAVKGAPKTRPLAVDTSKADPVKAARPIPEKDEYYAARKAAEAAEKKGDWFEAANQWDRAMVKMKAVARIVAERGAAEGYDAEDVAMYKKWATSAQAKSEEAEKKYQASQAKK